MATPRKPSLRSPSSRSSASSRSAPGRSSRPAGPSGRASERGGERAGEPATARRSAGERAESRSGARAESRSARAGAKAKAGSGHAGPPGTPARPPVLGPAPVLTTKQRCLLRGLGHHLDPVVQIGKEGITEPLCTAIAVALAHHELIKLRLAESVDGDRHGLAAELAARSHAALVQVLGRTILLYRRRPDDKSRRASESRPHVLPR